MGEMILLTTLVGVVSVTARMVYRHPMVRRETRCSRKPDCSSGARDLDADWKLNSGRAHLTAVTSHQNRCYLFLLHYAPATALSLLRIRSLAPLHEIYSYDAGLTEALPRDDRN
jgi:hypothetical protein